MREASRQIINLADIAVVQAERNGDRLALEFGGRSRSFADLDELSGRSAAALAAAGVGAGDRVAILARNSDDFFELLIACAKLDAMLLPLNWRLAAPELAYILADAEPKVVIADAAFAEALDEAIGIAGLAPLVVMADLAHGERAVYDAWRAGHPPRAPVGAAAESGALLLYTSGTTGQPKGAVIPHRALVEMRRLEAAHGPDHLRWTASDICLVSMPLFHIAGIRTAVAGLYNGCRLRVLAQFDAGEVLDAIAAGGVTKLFLVPAALQTLARHPRTPQADFSGLRYIFYGGAPITAPLLKECMAAFGCGFVQAYGSTETTGGVLTLGPEDHDPARPERLGSAGRPMAGIKVRILRPDGSSAETGEVGEVCIRGPATMSGYWRAPEASAEVLDAQGWVRTGDLGLLDADGFLHLRDRLKDMIITGGENVYPIEVENALASHPAVAEVAVLGAPSERWGEEVRAVVALRAGESASAEALIDWARRRIAAYKVPKALTFVEALPRNAAGKVLKRELRAGLA